ncbi:MAG: hypothetical protein ACKODY_04385 [Actinomycetota bacterium]
MNETINVVAAAVVAIGLVWAARRIEPHWSSRDGHRFIARAQALGAGDVPEGGWGEVRGAIEGEQIVLSARGIRAGRLRGTYRVTTKSPEPPRGKAVYLLSGDRRVVLRMPASSRTVTALDRLVG